MAANERAKKLSTKKDQSQGRAWTQFIRGYQRSPGALYCFYEGKDDQLYYNPRIRSIVFDSLDADIRLIYCEGKDNVLSLLAQLDKKSKYKRSWAAFFVDRDYDPSPTATKRLYVTPCYSLENFYVTTTALSKILSDEVRIPVDDEDGEHAATVRLFEQQFLQFNEVMQKIHTWIFCQRQMARETPSNPRLNFKDHDPSTLFIANLTEVKARQTLAEFTAKFPDAPPIAEDEWNQHLTKFTGADAACNARGKYIIYFFERFLTLLVEDRRQKDGRRIHFKSKGTVALNVSQNIVSVLTQYADIPACLNEFLSSLKTAQQTHLST